MGKNLGVFHLGTPKTAFLMRNLPMDTVIWAFTPTNRVTHFNFQKRVQETSPSCLASEPRKTNFVHELTKV